MRDVAVVSFAQAPNLRADRERNEVEIVMPVVREALDSVGLEQSDIGFTVSGSCDYLTGVPFSFVMALDAVGAWPPIEESHVEMDGAWALYEAWVRLQHGDIDTALIYSFGKTSLTDLDKVMSCQLDPYTLMPLWPGGISLAGLQASAMLAAGTVSEADMAAVASHSREAAQGNPAIPEAESPADVDELLSRPRVAHPLREHDIAPSTDGAAAIVLVAGDRAAEVCDKPAWIRGIDHRVDTHAPGNRDLTTCPSARMAGERAGAGRGGIEVAEVYAPFSHQQLLLASELGLGDGVDLNPSGGALAGHTFMVAGLARIGEAARRIHDGTASRVLGHATAGPCLQQNLVCVMEAGR